MNFDPYDSAAWRTFNMLDADESSLFDEAKHHDPILLAACLEMDRLAAAIAASTALPIEPKAGQLEHLQSRLGLLPERPSHFWLAVSGWAAAAVLAILLTLHLTGIIDQWNVDNTSSAPPHDAATATNSRSPNGTPLPALNPDLPGSPPTLKNQEVKPTTKVETKRLNQEIEVLRDNLEQFQNRDRALFAVVPGMALPIVMTMNPPGIAAEDSSSFTSNDDRSPITSLLGDALTALTGASIHPAEPAADAPPDDQSNESGDEPVPPKNPTAIPIYDAARDLGTLVTNNLPPANDGEAYNLWVTTKTGGHPIYVGTLPAESASGADSFDFSLGSTMVLPSGFILTKDPLGAPATPTETNTILQGPPTPFR